MKKLKIFSLFLYGVLFVLGMVIGGSELLYDPLFFQGLALGLIVGAICYIQLLISDYLEGW